MNRLIAIAALLCAWQVALAQEHPHEAPLDVVNLQAEASREVENDQLVAVLAPEAQGSNPAELAESVNKKMAEALKLAREVPSVKARSGNYQTFPRPGTDGRHRGQGRRRPLRKGGLPVFERRSRGAGFRDRARPPVAAAAALRRTRRRRGAYRRPRPSSDRVRCVRVALAAAVQRARLRR